MSRFWAVAAALFLALVWATAAQAAGSATPPAGGNADPFAVPDGTPQQLVAFIQGLLKQHPADAATQAKLRQAVIAAADKILAAKAGNKELLFAARVKAAMLKDPQELAAFEESLTKAGRKPAARAVHARLLALKLEGAAGDAAAFRKLLDEVGDFLRAGPLQQSEAELAMWAGEVAERSGDDKLAGDAYGSMAELLAGQPSLAPVVKRMQGCARRLKLVGNAMDLEGKTLDGKKLDWEKYRGKVVLVDFWATWCGPCMAEVRNIKENYQKYHDKGFEVVGISLDQKSSRELAEFVKKEAVPWTICRDADSPRRMAEYYGVSGIPNMILVGRDGKVVSLRVRGPSLGPQIEKALAGAGDVAQTPKDKSDAKRGADLKDGGEEDKAKQREALKKKHDEERQANAPKFREWTDATGKFRRTAKFRGMTGGVVKLELEDGRTISVPLEKLSDEDREYIDQRRK
jgi:peroxiredoxin